MLKHLRRAAAAISPVELFNGEQFRKAMGGRNPVMNLAQTFDQNMAAMHKRVHTAAPGEVAGIGGYFRGFNIGDSLADTSGQLTKFRSNIRRGAAAAGGAYLAGNLLLGGDNPISRAIGFGATAATHGAIGAGLYAAHPMAGIAYGGFGIMNMMRKGDNMGPF